MRRTNKPSSEKWIALAMAKGKGRPEELRRMYGNVATDGYRLHADKTLPLDPEPFTSRVVEILDNAQKNNNISSFYKYPLMMACLRAVAIGKGASPRDDYVPSLKIRINGNLEYEAITSENETRGNMPCEHTGDEISFLIDPRYLFEALSGMDDVVYLAAKSPNVAVYISDIAGKQAVIMPKRS